MEGQELRAPVFDPELVKGVQERAARALPPERVEDAGGWRLRYAPRCSRWVGTVLAHGDPGVDELAGRVEAAEAYYHGHDLPACFQVTPGVSAPRLDELLERRGYRRDRPMSLRAAATEEVRERVATGTWRTGVDDAPSREWFDMWYALLGHGSDPQAEWELLERVEPRSGFAWAALEDQVVAVGRVVAEAGFAGVFGLATVPVARGRGAARATLAAMAEWAGSEGAERMYTQVGVDETAALRLHERAGFMEVGAYHYRTET